MSGSGAFTVSNEYDWTGGYMRGSGSGTTIISSTGTLNIGNGAYSNEYLGDGSTTGRVLAINGTANLSGPSSGYGLQIYDTSGSNPGSAFVNNGTFNALDNGSIGQGIPLWHGSHLHQERTGVVRQKRAWDDKLMGMELKRQESG